MKKQIPSMDAWLREAKEMERAGKIGMYLVHNGVVRSTPKAQVREGKEGLPQVRGMSFSYDEEKLREAAEAAKGLPGICHVKVWLNQGELEPGEDIMYVLIGGDIRPNVVAALDFLVGRIKSRCVTETELY